MSLDLYSNAEFQSQLDQMLSTIKDRSAVHISVIDRSNITPCYAGFQDTKPAYWASVYKLDIAVALQNEIAMGRISWDTFLPVTERNAVDREAEIPSDRRPILLPGMRVTVAYLHDFMITGSSNTAANMLMDIVPPERINRFLHSQGWEDSDVTRKFMSLERAGEEYAGAKFTLQSARHFAELLYLMDTGKLPLSSRLRYALENQLDNTKISRGLPAGTLFAHKTGWFTKILESGKRVGVNADVGLVKGKGDRRRYIVACTVALPDEEGRQVLETIGHRLHAIM